MAPPLPPSPTGVATRGHYAGFTPTHTSHHPHKTAPAPPQPGPACSAGVLARRTKWRRSGGRPQGIPGGAPPPGPRATWGVRPCVGPGRGERALGQVDAVPRAWTRFRPGKRQPERRSPNQEHVQQPLGTSTRPRARSPTQEHAHLKAHAPAAAAWPARPAVAGAPGTAGRPTAAASPPSTTQTARRRRPPGASSALAWVTKAFGKATQARQPTCRRALLNPTAHNRPEKHT